MINLCWLLIFSPVVLHFQSSRWGEALKLRDLLKENPKNRIKSRCHVSYKCYNIISTTFKWVINLGSFQCLSSVPEFSSVCYQSISVSHLLHAKGSIVEVSRYGNMSSAVFLPSPHSITTKVTEPWTLSAEYRWWAPPILCFSNTNTKTGL